MQITKQALDHRREFLRGLFANPQGATLFEVIDTAVHAFNDDEDEAEPGITLGFPVQRARHMTSRQKIAV